MEVYAADGTPLRGDLITRVVLRTDLTPIPSTVEITAMKTRETEAAIKEKATVLIGPDKVPYTLAKVTGNSTNPVQQGHNDAAVFDAIGILGSCAALSERLQRSIIREGSTFAEIYRSIGATAVVDSDFPIPMFSAMIGSIPTPSIARVLQEESAVVYFEGGKVRFRRLAELMSTAAKLSFPVDRTEFTGSELLEKQVIPYTVSTLDDGSIITSRREAARGLVFRPRADQRTLNNMGAVLVQRRKMREGLSPTLNAGTRIDIAGAPHIVITAVHVRATSTDRVPGEEHTQLYLGELVT